MNPHDDPSALTGAFALDAVDEHERAAMEAALRESHILRDEISSMEETAVLLAYSTDPIEPPAELKATLMAKIATTPQHPAADNTHAARPAPDVVADAPADTPAPVIPLTGNDAAPELASAVDAPTSTSVGAAERARLRWFQRPAQLLTAAAAAVAIFVGGGLTANAVFDHSTTSPASSTASGMSRIYAAADFQRATAPVQGGGSATVVWSDQLRQSAVILKHVPPAPSGKTYELWYIGTTIRPAGTVSNIANGTTSAMLIGSMSPADTIGITIEPAGGTKQPTTKPIVAIPTTGQATGA
ncbi:anti-sigma factor [Curtobacterium ammoniigenes]|uniref:anti-sigma factor n=1 Tax=Curtobacterium ammoniigenes TaxID=395387 RepID=UPI0008347F97|nr:anti-sigma factor [Curtobacterium ammoniigenes]